MDKSLRKSYIISVLFIFIIGSLFHFAYDFSGRLWIIGIFTPVSESIFEHLKLAIYPTILCFLIFYIILNRNLDFYKWFYCCAISCFISPIIIISFFYSYTGALGFTSLILDIFSLFLAVSVAQFISMHIYTYTKMNKVKFYTAISLLFLILIIFTIFTFQHPDLPIFIVANTNI